MPPTNPKGSRPLWVLHIGNNDRIALRALDEGFVCIGWTAMGDLTNCTTRAEIRALMEKTWPGLKAKSVSSSYGQVYRFAHEIELGDLIVFPVRPTSEIAIGRVSGPYVWSTDPDLMINDYNNVRRVDWLKTVPRTSFSQAALHSFGSFSTLSTSNDYLEEVQAIIARGVPVTAPEIARANDEILEEAEAINLFEAASQETEDFLLKSWRRTGGAFEQVVGAVFEALGYTATVTPLSGDHGIDVIAHPDPLGLQRPLIKIQVKSGTGIINESEINKLRGTLNQGEQGVMVSLGKFNAAAEAVARNTSNVTLVGPKRFVKLFLDHYDKLAPEWRAKFPLKQVFVPFQ